MPANSSHQDDGGDDALAPFRVGHAKDDRFLDGRVAREDVLDFARRWRSPAR
jgi:hypothetical protein